jgi:hypothetical protein
VIKTQLSYGFTRTHDNKRVTPEDVGEQVSRDGDLGHLEGDVAAMSHDLETFALILISFS